MVRLLGRLILSAALGGSVGAMAAKGPPPAGGDGIAEAKLIQVYKLVGAGQTRQALHEAEALVRQFPNFQLAQLVLGDLLAVRGRPLTAFGDVPDDLRKGAAENLLELRGEAQLRIAAHKHRPAQGAVPAQFLKLSAFNKHAIAVDVSRARLYLFEHKAGAVRLVADYYISIGKAGVAKTSEGDQRTPLGLYFITSNLDPKSLKDLYGSGALPINYPNAYDVRRGKTGSGIWLHGTPAKQFARAPQATDGCVAVANPDLLRIIRTVEIQSTPVLIAQSLKWVASQELVSEVIRFDATVDGWARAKSAGDMPALLSLYAADFAAEGNTLKDHQQQLQQQVGRQAGRAVRLTNLSVLGWSDDAPVRVVTFFESVAGTRGYRSVRQYWERRGNSWRIVYETTLRQQAINGLSWPAQAGIQPPAASAGSSRQGSQR